MQQYDIATKILMESCRDEIIRRFIGIDVTESVLIEELPQETASVKRSDYPVMVTDEKGASILALIEIQTHWNRGVPLNMLDYRARHLLKHNLEAVSCLILLRPSGAAVEFYKDNQVHFKYVLVKIFEMDARQVVREGSVCLAPFVPLMQNGAEVLAEADTLIYKSGLPRENKADMLTSMALLSGLISKDLPAELISRRRDIMIESAAYDMIKKEGFLEGIQEGIQKGIQKGIQRGRDDATREVLSEMLLVLLEVKFGLEGIRIYDRIKHVQDPRKLKSLMEAVKLTNAPEEVPKFIESDE